MRKEYVVVRVDAAPDASPYVTVSLSSKKDVQEKNGPPSSPFGKSNVMGNTTSIKLDMIEYKKLGLSVGDKVFLDLTKAESSGV